MRQYAPIVNQYYVVLQAPELTLLALPQTSDRAPVASLLAQNLAGARTDATSTSTDIRSRACASYCVPSLSEWGLEYRDLMSALITCNNRVIALIQS